MFPLILKKIVLIISHMKWAWEILLHQSIFPSSYTTDVLHSIDSHTVRQTVLASEHNHAVDSNECAVCLCDIDGGEETRLLKCNHVFHRVCLDRWVGYGRWTCPLCRNHLRVFPDTHEFHQEILVFSFADVSSGDKNTWWLR